MIHMHPGSQAGSLAAILSVVGEYPYSSLHLLGNERYFRKLVHKLTEKNELYNSECGERLYCKCFNLSGKGAGKTIRFYKDAIPILKWISPDALPSYMNASKNHKFSGDVWHIERNHRIAEVVAMCMRSGIEYRPYVLPELQDSEILSVIPKQNVFYPSRRLKEVRPVDQNKTMFTRMAGAIFSHQKCFAVYNTRNSSMRWNGMGEFKALHSLSEIARMNADVTSINSAILFGQSDKTALGTLKAAEEIGRHEFRFDKIYQYVHFVPLSDNGIRLLRLICHPKVKEKLLDLLFESDTISNGRGIFEYDAYVYGKYILSHLDGDIIRLIRFKEALLFNHYEGEVLCFDFQKDYVNAFLEGLAKVRTIEMGLIEEELGIS